MGWRFKALVIIAAVVCVGISDAHAMPKFAKNCRARLISAAAVACLSAGCSLSRPDVVTSSNNFDKVLWVEEFPEFQKRFDEKESERKYRWILHISFLPQDFGHYDKAQPTLLPKSPEEVDRLRRKGFPLKFPAEGEVRVSDFAAPQEVRVYPDSPYAIGTFIYRFNGAERAMALTHELIPPAAWKDILLIVSGGSHGSSEVNRFSELMKEEYNKAPDILVLGDPIQQPAWFAMDHFDGLPSKTLAIEAFQGADFLRGQALPGFWSIELGNIDHPHLADQPKAVASGLAWQIVLDHGHPRIYPVHEFLDSLPEEKAEKTEIPNSKLTPDELEKLVLDDSEGSEHRLWLAKKKVSEDIRQKTLSKLLQSQNLNVRLKALFLVENSKGHRLTNEEFQLLKSFWGEAATYPEHFHDFLVAHGVDHREMLDLLIFWMADGAHQRSVKFFSDRLQVDPDDFDRHGLTLITAIENLAKAYKFNEDEKIDSPGIKSISNLIFLFPQLDDYYTQSNLRKQYNKVLGDWNERVHRHFYPVEIQFVGEARHPL